MKNSLFKRAIAVAATVPMALTQCLGVTNVFAEDGATATATAPAASQVTLNDGAETALLYIDPVGGYEEEGNTFVKDSVWNQRMYTAIISASGSDKKSGTIDMTEAYKQAVAKSGKYAEITQAIIDKMGEVKYNINSEGVVTIKGSVDNVTDALTQGYTNAANNVLNDLAEKYGITDLGNPADAYKDVVIKGNFEVKVNTDTLNDSTTVSAEFKFTDGENGKVYEGAAAADWAIAKLDELKNAIKTFCKDFADQGLDLDDAGKQIDESFDFYVSKLNNAKSKLDKAVSFSKDETSYDSFEAAVTAFDSWKDSTKANIPAKIKNAELSGLTAADIAAKDKVQSAYAKAFAQIAAVSPITFDVAINEFAEAADSLYDIKASASNGTYTLTAKMPDKEEAAAKEYIEKEKGVEVTNVYKEVSVVANASDVKSGKAEVKVDVKRVVEVQAKETTTTSATTTEATETTTVATETEATEVSTTVATETEATEVSTTVATETEATEVSTTAATETEAAEVSTTAATETEATEASTTEATEATEASTTAATETEATEASTTEATETVTTTTATVSQVIPGETTTKVVRTSKVNYKTETVVGFYLNTAPEFNKSQIKSIKYSIDRIEEYIGEDGKIISTNILRSGTENEIDLSKVYFEDTPGDIFKTVNEEKTNQFAFNVTLYAAEQIVAPNGTIVCEKGDALVDLNDETVGIQTYVGVKGDADLDMDADTSDSSCVLVWYSKMMTGSKPSETTLTTNKVLVEADPMLDELAAFLCDVDNDDVENNGLIRKSARTIASDDASKIAIYYSKVMTGSEAGAETWNKVLGK